MRLSTAALAAAQGLWIAGALSVASAQESGEALPPPPPPGAEEVPPPPPPGAEEVPPPPPPGYGGAPQGGYPSAQGAQHYPQRRVPEARVAPESLPGYRTHDGFYLRLALGVGYLSSAADAGGGDVHYFGGAVGLSVAIGGALAENLIVYGTIYGISAGDPGMEVDGEEDFADDPSVALGAAALGVGVAYYVMPLNLFVAGSIGIGMTTMEGEWQTVISDPAPGPRVQLLVGKEWWVSPNWGLGPALELFWGSSKGSIDFAGPPITRERVTFQTFGGALYFSATYN